MRKFKTYVSFSLYICLINLKCVLSPSTLITSVSIANYSIVSYVCRAWREFFPKRRMNYTFVLSFALAPSLCSFCAPAMYLTSERRLNKLAGRSGEICTEETFIEFPVMSSANARFSVLYRRADRARQPLSPWKMCFNTLPALFIWATWRVGVTNSWSFSISRQSCGNILSDLCFPFSRPPDGDG